MPELTSYGPGVAGPGRPEATGGGKHPRYLIFSIDTEPDDPDWRGPRAAGLSLENLRAWPEISARLADMGVKSTFLCSHAVATHPTLPAALEPLMKRGLCEVGAHLHPGDTPPFGPWDDEARDNLIRLDPERRAEKFLRLHAEITGRFGRPRSFRSAAWSIDPGLARLLIEHGYEVDSSVTPGVSWSWIGRPSYLEAPGRAYYLDPDAPGRPGDSSLLEVPVSIWIPRRWNPTESLEAMAGHLFTMPLSAKKGLLAFGVRKLRPRPPQWLRPAFMDLRVMREVAGRLSGEEYLHVMCHSNELWAGASPYSPTQGHVDRIRDRLMGILSFCLERGYTPVTLSEYAARFRGEAGGEGRPPELSRREPRGARKRNPWMVAIKAGVSLAALAVAVRVFDLDEMKVFLARSSPWLAGACLAAIFLDIWLSAVKAARLTGPPAVLPARIFRFNLVKILFNNFLPGGVGGEAVRTMSLAREMGSTGGALAVVLWDRLSGLWVQILATVASLVVLASRGSIPGLALWVMLAGLAAAATLAFVLGPSPALVKRILAGLPLGDAGFLRSRAEEFAARWILIASDRGRLLRAMGLGAVIQAVMVATLCLAAACLGGRISWEQASPILLLGGLSSLLPFTLGGLGVTEGAISMGFAFMGSQNELGFMAALLIRGLCFIPALAGWAVMVRDQVAPLASTEAARS